MAGYPARVRISKRSDQQPSQSDRASALAGAENALFAANVEAVKQTPLVSLRERQNGQDEDAFSDAIQDDATVYLTDSFRDWECHYLRRLAKQIHRLVCAELDRTEESLFMAYVSYDSNLDGQIRGDEARDLLEAIHHYTPNATNEDDELLGRDGWISFLSLLGWYSREDGDYQETTTTMTVTSLAVGALGSGYVGSDSRINALSWRELRANVLGYRKLHGELRAFKEERRLLVAKQKERDLGLEEGMPEYYNALASEFEGDGEHLFELFNEVDESGNLLLETNEVETLLSLLDTNATKEDLARYIAEINLTDGPLSFASLVDWWDQARNVPNSLVAEKGMALIASVRARVMSKSLGGFVSSDSTAKKKWLEAAAKSSEHLEALRDAYIRTLNEVREYKTERDLRAAEVEAAKL